MTNWKDKAGATLLIFVLVVVSVWFLYKFAQEHYNKEQAIFVMNDVKGDDHGPGTYEYPIDSIFDPKEKHFDLNRFSFSSYRNMYYFDMSFPLVTNPWGAPEGFSHTMVQIYISDNPDRGRIEPFKPGANVLFDPGNPWRYLIKVVSFNKATVYWASDFEGAEGRRTDMSARLRPDGNTIRVTVPKRFLPGDPYKWKYYVLVGSQDGMGPDNFRVVRAKIGQYNFGGGADTEYSPNIIDLLAPPKEQEKMLSSFSVPQNTQAVIKPVGPSETSPGTWEIFLDKTISVLQKLKVNL